MPGTAYRKHTKDATAARLIGLVMACPLQQDNPSDCPLHKIRQLPVKERFIWVKSRAQKEALEILRQHSICLRQKQ